MHVKKKALDGLLIFHTFADKKKIHAKKTRRVTHFCSYILCSIPESII